jgi:hypothetical protein
MRGWLRWAGSSSKNTSKNIRKRKAVRQKVEQTRLRPLLNSAQDLKEKLEVFTNLYGNPPDHWETYQYDGRALPLAARDFHELYFLDTETGPIENFQDLKPDPGEQRRNQNAVRRVRSRIHELNRATVLRYLTAAYLGYAGRVRKELLYGRFAIPAGDNIIRLLENVKVKLNGSAGAGVIDDLQDLIGESVWGADDSVISYYNFREKILAETGWEQFTDLFRFYVHFHRKLGYEVKDTIEALAGLCDALKTSLKPPNKFFR